MKIKLIKLAKLSGTKASIYGIWYEQQKRTSLDIFLEENNVFLSELNDIITRLRIMGNKTGAREQYFKLEEGNLSDGVCALFDTPDKKLRLYCIRYGALMIIVGGGGPKAVKTLQESSKLKTENFLLRELSAQITSRIKEKEIKYINNMMDFGGNLEFDITNHEKS